MKPTLEEFIASYPAWSVSGETLVGNWQLTDFAEVQSAVAKLCILAESLNHHPTVTFDYNSITVETTTHDAGNAITHKDIELAERVSELMVTK